MNILTKGVNEFSCYSIDREAWGIDRHLMHDGVRQLFKVAEILKVNSNIQSYSFVLQNHDPMLARYLTVHTPPPPPPDIEQQQKGVYRCYKYRRTGVHACTCGCGVHPSSPPTYGTIVPRLPPRSLSNSFDPVVSWIISERFW